VSEDEGVTPGVTPAPAPAPGRPRVVAIVAAKNGADSVGETVAALRGLAGVDEVLVVDDGSTDATSAVAAQAGAWVLRLPVNVGKGGAVAAGIATSSETDIYLLVDADVGVTAGAAAALLEPLLEGQADLVIGVLPGAGGKGGFGLVRRLAAAGIERACGFVAQAPLSGQRAVRGELLRGLDLAPRFGLETGFTIDAVRAGARVLEVPVAMDHRHTGRRLAGFVHRGRQGVDISRALWVRLTTARTRVAVVVGSLVLALLAMAWTGSRWEADTLPATTTASKVLLVGIPGLGWDDVGDGTMPNLDRLIESGGLAAMSVRTGSSHPAVAEGYATLGAGARVRVDNTAAADVASDGFGPVSVAAAADLRRTAGRHLPTRPGDLGEALHAAGRTTAVVGVADIAEGLVGPNVPQDRPARFRPAPLALMDRDGDVDTGKVDGSLLMADGSGPFGERADPEQVAAATARALAEADVVLVDTGDMSRAEALAELAPPVFADLKRDFALKDTDAVLGRILADVEPSTLVLVVSVVPPDDEWRLTPVVAAGPGVARGLLASPSTKRLGLVTLTDIAPTVLAALGEAVPVEMIGHPLRYSTVEPTLGRLTRLDRDAAYRERVYFGVAAGFVVAQGVVYALALAVFSGRRRTPIRAAHAADGAGGPGDPAGAGRARGRWPRGADLAARLRARAPTGGDGVEGRPPPAPTTATPTRGAAPRAGAGGRWPPPAVAATLVRLGVIAFAAFPLATFLLRAIPFVPALGAGGVAVLVALDAAIVALAVRARRHPLSPLAWVMGATVAVLALDVATGARLQTASILGYSPHTAARFYGLGNSAFAVLAGTTILAAALHLEHAPRRRDALVTVAALFALVLVVDGAPSLGDDVGGILTLGPIFALTLVALSGRRITWRAVAVALMATVAVLAVVAGIDLLRPPEARTHLGRVVSDTLNGHGGLGTTVARKAEANVRVFRASIWAWVVPIVAAFVLGLLVWQLKLDDLLPPRSARRIGVVAAVAAGVLGCLVNDSGIVVTALVLVFVAPFLTLLALSDERDRGRPVLLEPALDLTSPSSLAQPTEAR
jgi:hypothetical protein